MRKRLLSLMIILCMTVSMMPTSVLASDVSFQEISESDFSDTYVEYVTESNDEIAGDSLVLEDNGSDDQYVSGEEQVDEGNFAEGDNEFPEDELVLDEENDFLFAPEDTGMQTKSIEVENETNATAEQSQVRIVQFEELDKHVAYQHMVCGSNEEDINFPEEITAQISSRNDKNDSDMNDNSSDGLGDQNEMILDDEELMMDAHAMVESRDSEITINGIEWKIKTEQSDFEEYSSQFDGLIYVYELMMPEGYSVGDDVELPTITVVVGDLGQAPPMLLFEAGKNVDGFIAPIDDPDASAVKITTAEELAAISNDMYGTYVLMNDIDMSEYGNWEPIGKTLSSAFRGKFDGQGHTISGLSVSVSFDNATLLQPYYTVGLFGVCDGAQVKNVSLQNVDISISTTSGYRYENSIIDSDGTVFAGAIVGYARNSSVIYNCNVSGSVSASASGEGYSPTVAGGLVGYAISSIISYSYNVGAVTSYNGNATVAENAYAGGLLGRAEVECIIDKSYNSGMVSSRTLDYGDSFAGGLIADTAASSTSITNAFNEGNVQSVSGNLFSDSAYAGGVIAAFQGEIDKVYNSGTVIAQANDPYSINSTKAYAGGICANSSTTSTIKNSAILQETVSASASGTKYQYRISNSGTKLNNITISSVTANSTNDANHTYDRAYMTTADVYVDVLGWDFTSIWELVSGIDFPQLKQVDTAAEEYDQEYVEQHLNFINNGSYQDILNNYRWAQIYWSEENNFKSNLAGALYTGVDKLVDLSTLDFGALFDDGNPFKVMLADYISDQTVEEGVAQLYKVKIPYELDKKYKKVKKFIQDNWKDEWGELSDEDLFWLFHYEDKTSDEWINSGFEDHISEIVYGTRHSTDGLETVLGITTETLDEILEQKKNLDNTIDWFNSLITYSGHVAAYVQANEEFKIILEEMCNNLPASNASEIRYKTQLYLVIKSYTQYDDSEHLAAQVFTNYLLDSSVNKFESVIKKTINTQINNWIKDTFSAIALDKLNKIGWVADKTWKICEYVTKNGELQECREMLKANAYFEDTMYRTLLSFESQFRISQTFENACLFDAAFKFFKETEICSMDTVIAYFNTYQTSWLQAIRNTSNTFMNSAIEEVQINKLFLYNTYCHGTSYTLGGKVITIACPTNVYIYSEDGELVVSIEDNIVTYCASNLLAYTTDAVKMVTVPTDQNYSVRIDATSNGTMSYSISEYNAGKENVQTTVYTNVPINQGDSYSGVINNEIETESQTYNLSGSDDTIVDDFETVTQNTNVPVSGVEIIEPVEILSVGDTASFTTEILPENATIKSIAWSSSDPSVLSVSENGNLTAISEGTAIVSAHSIYGGVGDSMEIVVMSDEHTLLFRKQPQSAMYVANEQADALEVTWYEKNSDDEVVFQWYVADSEESDGSAIEGANEESYVPPTTEAGVKYYYVTISDSFETRISERACINVISEKILDSGSLGNNLEWELTESLVLRITGIGDLASSDINDLPWIDYQESIHSVEVAEGITSVGENVFTGMSQLKTLSLPKSLQSVSEGAFSGCNSLLELSVPFVGTGRNEKNTANAVLGAIFGRASSDGVTQYYSLSGTSLSGYNYDIPSSLRTVAITDATQIPFGSFYNCTNIESIVLNEGIETIGGYAFDNCSTIEELTIPSTVTTIESGILSECINIKSLSVPFIGSVNNANNSSDAVLGYFFGGSSSGTVQYYSQTDTSLSGSKYDIPDSLDSVIVTNAIQIPFGAFSNCGNLSNVLLNDGVETIDGYAFYNCVGLTTIIVPNSVTAIEEYALNGCNSLSEITIPFVGANRNVSGTYDGALGYIFGRTSSASSNYYIQYSVLEGTSLSGYGYAVPTALTSVIVTDATQIPIGAFSNLTDLKSVTFNSGISEIGAYAFYNATCLTDVYYNDWETEWNKIDIDSGNDILDDVTVHYLESLSKLYGASLRLTGDIGVNFYYEFTNSMINDPNAGINITVGNGKTERVGLGDAVIDTTSEPGKTLYKFTCYVSAKQMNDSIFVQATATDYKETVHTYSIRKYADNIIANDKYSAELKYLVRVMMRYGASSQQYLDYNTANLADNGIEISDVISAANALTTEELDDYVSQKTDMPEGISLYGANLSLKSETVLRYHFTLEEGHDITEYVFTVNGNEYTPVVLNGRYCIEINNIRAQDLDEMFTVTVTDKNGNFGSVTYGALTYTRNIINAGTTKYSQALVDTVRSLYLYNRAAEAYLASKS